jgi:integrase
MKMKITFNSDIEDKKFNYLDVKKKQFIFNVYKTAKEETKKNGSLIIDIPEDLMKVLETYIKFHPLKKQTTKGDNIPFLVYYNGEPLNKVNTITRILNKIFGKNIGASMLRHSYLSYKYGDLQKEQEKDAKAMSHNVMTQKDYIKQI